MGTEKTDNTSSPIIPSSTKIELQTLETKKTDSEEKIEMVKSHLKIPKSTTKVPLKQSHRTSLSLKTPSARADYAIEQLTKVLSVEANEDDLSSQYGYINRYLDQYEKALKEDSFLKWIGFVASKYFPSLSNPTVKQAIDTCDIFEKFRPDIATNFEKTKTYEINKPEHEITNDFNDFIERNK